MTLTFRWYGPDDPVRLDHVRQIPGVEGIVSALHAVPPGEAWPRDAVAAHREQIEVAGLRWSVVESIPVAESVKLGADGRDTAIDAFCRSLDAVGAEGIGTVCYNFMPVFDWTRTDLALRLPDGSTTLAYRHADLPEIEAKLASGGLPGWMTAFDPDDLAALRAAYAEIDAERLWDHLAYFLDAVVPVAEAAGVRLAIHPDDPPWPVFGLPRIVTSGAALRRVCGLVDSPANGVCLCTGSLGADPSEATLLPATVHSLAGRTHFVHLRNVRHSAAHADGAHDFAETAHPDGAVDFAAVLRALAETGFRGPARPDHGRMVWSEVGQEGVRPGYGLYDRALGAAYLLGLWTAVSQRAEGSGQRAENNHLVSITSPENR
ncbi:MAG: mannonate dehydratase [Bacteroidota bacterium]